MLKDPACLEKMEKLLEVHRPDALIPGTDLELSLFAQHRHTWEGRFGAQVIVSNPQVVQIADDKYETFRFLRDKGFVVPDSCLPGEEDALVGRVGFPLIVKPRIGARSVGVVMVHNTDELKRAIAEGDNVVIQECVATEQDEYTAGALVFDGVCEASIVMRRDLSNGNTARAYVESFPELNVQVKKWATALAPHGPVNFQFRVDREGNARVFEINARFSGTTPFRMLAGFNEVELVLRRLLDETPIVEPEIAPMTILRHFTETVIPQGQEFIS